jgi:hypothetical protein
MKVFGLMYQEANKMDAASYRELLDIAAVPSQPLNYYKQLRARYNSMIFPGPKELPPRPPSMYLKSDSPDRKDIVLSIFRAAKRGMGYG